MMIRKGVHATGKIVEKTDKVESVEKFGDIPEDVAAMLNAQDEPKEDEE